MNDEIELGEPTDAARAKVLDLTLRVVRTRRRMRKAAAFVTIAAAFAAGFATSALVLPRPPAAAAPSSDVREPRAIPAVAAADATAPADLESRARAAPSDGERADLLRKAGDRYLDDFGDVEAALRCYRELLKLAAPTEHTRSHLADNWLLAALKGGSD